MRADEASALAGRVLAGERRAVARALSRVENGGDAARDVLAALYPHSGRAYVIGITGAPGTGKSSLVNALAKAYRQSGQSVGIIAVDPTSPFSGGAILGDRVRMRDLAGDEGIFIRSMATRGSLGGLAETTAQAIVVLDAAGFERILVETVGVGQAEVDIAAAAHTTLVVEAPGLGDDVQAIKAGVLEIADVLVVNKADRDGAQRTAAALKAMLSLAAPAGGHHGAAHGLAADEATDPPGTGWTPPVCLTVATHGEGIDALLEAIESHAAYLRDGGRWLQRRRTGASNELLRTLQRELLAQFLARVPPEQFEALVAQIAARQLTPHEAARRLLAEQGIAWESRTP